jgi:hypothetical protein
MNFWKRFLLRLLLHGDLRFFCGSASGVDWVMVLPVPGTFLFPAEPDTCVLLVAGVASYREAAATGTPPSRGSEWRVTSLGEEKELGFFQRNFKSI